MCRMGSRCHSSGVAIKVRIQPGGTPEARPNSAGISKDRSVRPTYRCSESPNTPDLQGQTPSLHRKASKESKPHYFNYIIYMTLEHRLP